MHKRAREHVSLVVKRKLMRRQRRITSGKDWYTILHGCSIELFDVHSDTAARIFCKKPTLIKE